MKNRSKIVQLAGILMLTQMITAVISYSVLLDPILYGTHHFLDAISANVFKVRFSALLDFICAASFFGFSVVVFPILKPFSERIALWYMGIRLSELMTMVISGILILTLVSVSFNYVEASGSDNTALGFIGKQVLSTRGHTQNMSLFIYCFGSTLFYYLLYRSKLLPRFISVWGLVGIVGIFTHTVLSIFGYHTGNWMYIIMMPMGLNEIFLGLWLIFKGFNITSS